MKKLIAALLCTLLAPAYPLSAAEDTSLYFLRHAEVDDDGTGDPALSKSGEERARTIAALFAGNNVTHIFSTPLRRTIETAQPTAQDHGLTIEEYSGRDLQAFAEALGELQGTILVVGHSNTTPAMVNLLTGENFEALDERVYDRVYVVTVDSEGKTELEINHTEPRTPLH